MKLRVIGDIHGDYNWYLDTVRQAESEGIPTFQIGDFGIGFAGSKNQKRDEQWVNDKHNLSENHRFGMGNHDNPLYAKVCPACVGYLHTFNEFDGMWIGGANSIDRDWRTPGINWWEREEISYSEGLIALERYTYYKPKYMFSHDAPVDIAFEMFPEVLGMHRDAFEGSRTGHLLQQCFEAHRPKYWFFGHWHRTRRFEKDGTIFQCVGAKEYVDLDLI